MVVPLVAVVLAWFLNRTLVGKSVKAAADVAMPVGGEVVEVNEELRADPSLANKDPMGNGWFFKVRIADMTEYDQLMDVPEYDALLKTL